jgi:hypothetical protein
MRDVEPKAKRGRLTRERMNVPEAGATLNPEEGIINTTLTPMSDVQIPTSYTSLYRPAPSLTKPE